jgi:fungal type III polyketide synthase
MPSSYRDAADFDWAMHPGGATILSGAEKALSITPEHMRASYDTYINHGNSSSATILSVLDRLRHKDMDAMAPAGRVKDYVVGCAFGPGIAVEMCMLKRNLGTPSSVLTGLQTPPETESEASSNRSDDGEEMDLDNRLDSTRAVDEVHESAQEERKVQLSEQQTGSAGVVGSGDERFINEALAQVELD